MTLAIFAEGTDSTDPNRNSFLALWTWIVQRAGAMASPRIVGFNKGNLVRICKQGIDGNALRIGENPDDVVELSRLPEPQREPLDILIARAHRVAPFDRIVLAFDREPKHDALKNRCRRAELFLTLTNLAASNHLPGAFRDAAFALREGYLRRPAPRPRDERLSVEVVVMERLFEDLLLCDEKGLRNALGLGNYPKDWPSFKSHTPKPDEHIFKPACKLASLATHRRLGDRDCRDKHKWAKYILERLPEESPVWRHPIFTRLQDLVV